MRASRRAYWYVGHAVWAWLGARWRGPVGAGQMIDPLNEQEDCECDYQKIDDRIDEQSDVQGWRAGRLCRRDRRVMLRRKVDEQVGEIDRAQCQPNRRHQDVGSERSHNFPERGADHESDSEIDHVALDCELLELRDYRHDAPSCWPVRCETRSPCGILIRRFYQSTGARQCKTGI